MYLENGDNTKLASSKRIPAAASRLCPRFPFALPVCFAFSVTLHFSLIALLLFRLPLICFLLFCQHRFLSAKSSTPQLTKNDPLIFLLFLFSSLAELRFVRYNFSSTDDRTYRAFTVTERIYHL